jgi:hypothetical protein
MLAYVFWHVPARPQGYEDALRDFHASLAAHPSEGFGGSWTLRLPAPPWFDRAPQVYMDWYLVTDFTALGALNEAAVSGPRTGPHDAAAERAGAGTAGVVGCIGGEPARPHDGTVVAFFEKPRDVAYADFRSAVGAALPDRASAWMRQMTLGTGPEFAVLADREPDVPAAALCTACAVIAA